MLVGYQSSTFHEEIELTNEDILIIFLQLKRILILLI